MDSLSLIVHSLFLLSLVLLSSNLLLSQRMLLSHSCQQRLHLVLSLLPVLLLLSAQCLWCVVRFRDPWLPVNFFFFFNCFSLCFYEPKLHDPNLSFPISTTINNIQASSTTVIQASTVCYNTLIQTQTHAQNHHPSMKQPVIIIDSQLQPFTHWIIECVTYLCSWCCSSHTYCSYPSRPNSHCIAFLYSNSNGPSQLSSHLCCWHIWLTILTSLNNGRNHLMCSSS